MIDLRVMEEVKKTQRRSMAVGPFEDLPPHLRNHLVSNIFLGFITPRLRYLRLLGCQQFSMHNSKCNFRVIDMRSGLPGSGPRQSENEYLLTNWLLP